MGVILRGCRLAERDRPRSNLGGAPAARNRGTTGGPSSWCCVPQTPRCARRAASCTSCRSCVDVPNREEAIMAEDKPRVYEESEIPARLSELGLAAWYLEEGWLR